jgi:hypothetical protein
MAVIRNAIKLSDSRVVRCDFAQMVSDYWQQYRCSRPAAYCLQPRVVRSEVPSGRSNEHEWRASEPLAQWVVAEHGCQRLRRQ